MDQWRANFSSFWPHGNDLFVPPPGILPGAPAVIHLSLPGGIKVFTGALVMQSSPESFSLMTLQGHMFCGWITFSSFIEDGTLYAQTQALLRPADALFDLSFRTGFGTRAEDSFWHASLLNLARHFGVEGDGAADQLPHRPPHSIRALRQSLVQRRHPLCHLPGDASFRIAPPGGQAVTSYASH